MSFCKENKNGSANISLITVVHGYMHLWGLSGMDPFGFINPIWFWTGLEDSILSPTHFQFFYQKKYKNFFV